MKIIHQTLLGDRTSLHAGGPAETLIELGADDDFAEIVASQKSKIWVLGYGTNCLISDEGLPGTVVINKAGRFEKLSDTRYKVDAGYNWDDFVQAFIGEGLWGLEFTSGIPGGTGAAVAGNIAAYGHKVADCFIEADIFDLDTGRITVWENQDFNFNYRSSAIQREEHRNKVILTATFELSSEPTGDLEYESALKVAAETNTKPGSLYNRRKIILETRRRAGSLLHDMKAGPYTAGSFFKNPVINEEQVQNILGFEEHGVSKEQLLRQNTLHSGNSARVSAAHVLLAAGFKRGQTWGNVRLHPDHILKIENLGKASAQEIYDVVQIILGTVKEKLDIELEPEVRFLGEF